MINVRFQKKEEKKSQIQSDRKKHAYVGPKFKMQLEGVGVSNTSTRLAVRVEHN